MLQIINYFFKEDVYIHLNILRMRSMDIPIQQLESIRISVLYDKVLRKFDEYNK